MEPLRSTLDRIQIRRLQRENTELCDRLMALSQQVKTLERAASHYEHQLREIRRRVIDDFGRQPIAIDNTVGCLPIAAFNRLVAAVNGED